MQVFYKYIFIIKKILLRLSLHSDKAIDVIFQKLFVTFHWNEFNYLVRSKRKITFLRLRIYVTKMYKYYNLLVSIFVLCNILIQHFSYRSLTTILVEMSRVNLAKLVMTNMIPLPPSPPSQSSLPVHAAPTRFKDFFFCKTQFRNIRSQIRAYTLSLEFCFQLQHAGCKICCRKVQSRHAANLLFLLAGDYTNNSRFCTHGPGLLHILPTCSIHGSESDDTRDAD
jgi:hypothetical protein